MSNQRKRARDKTRRLFERVLRDTLARPEQITVSQWAEKYRILDESSALPGRWRNTITPYLREIMDCINDPYVNFINFVKSSQVGGTEFIINAIEWIVTKNPSPTMVVYPTDDLAKDVSNDKLQPAFGKTPEVKERFLKTKSSELNLKFKHMNLYLRSGNSPSKLASKAIKYLFFDEIDKMSGATKREASPYNLATERTKTFKNSRKIVTVSTPTYKTNYVWKFHEEAEEQRRYFVPCPHCDSFILLQWEDIKFAPDEERIMTPVERAKTAVYVCPECGGLIEDKQKLPMLQRGEWRDVKGTCKRKAQSVSYHINSLYSFFVSWYDVALEFLKSRDDPEELQNFVNSWLGEAWEDTKLRTNSDLVLERQTDDPAGVVPEWALMLTAGVDVQETSVYFDIVAWGKQRTNQSILHGQVLSINDIVEYMDMEYSKTNGEKLMVALCLVDSGDQTQMVYDFCMQYSEWAIPVKGYEMENNHYRITQINKAGSAANGQSLVLCSGARYKDMIASQLQKPNGYGSCMVHKDCDLEYAQQLTAEHKIAEGTGRKRKLVWRTKMSHGDNHYLDCRVYASCAADMKGVRSFDMMKEEPEAVSQHKTEQKQSSWLQSKGW